MINIDQSGILCCSGCGNNNLHHESIEIFEKQLIANRNGITIRGRREEPHQDDGIKMIFNCEHCDKKTTLTITQHKGNTFVEQKRVSPSVIVSDPNADESLEDIINAAYRAWKTNKQEE